MRVLQWLNTFLPDTGGIQTFCAELIPVQIARGHEVMILTGHSQDPMPDHSKHGSIEVHRVDSLRPLLHGDPRGMLLAKARITRIIDDFDPDIIHLHPCGPELAYFLPIDRKRHRPMMLTLHNNFSDVEVGFGPDTTFGRAFGIAERIACVSDDARHWLESVRPDLADRTSTVHNGIPTVSESAPTELPWDPPLLTYVGRLAPQKQLHHLLDAFASVAAAHPTVALEIVGDGPEMPALVAQAERLGVGDRVAFIGRVEPAAIPEILARTTIFVLSSLFEGLPIALLEAARHGRPTVATDVGGVGEIVLQGTTGTLVPRENPAALADAICALLDDSASAERFGAAAREHFLANFDLGSCADTYDRLYEATVRSGATGE